jgi:hypothetical protein
VGSHHQQQQQQELQARLQLQENQLVHARAADMQQSRRSSVAHAGSFQVPDSDPTSAATSARPSVSQLSAQPSELKRLSINEQLAALQQAAASSGRSRAASTRQSSTSAHSAGTAAMPGTAAPAVPAALLQARFSASQADRLSAAGGSAAGSGANTPTGVRLPSSPGMPQAAIAGFNAVGSASRASRASDARGVQQGVEKARQQLHKSALDLEQLAIPKASLPGSTRSSISNLTIGQLQQQQQQPARPSALQSSSSLAVRPSPAAVRGSITAVSAPGSSPGTSSDWKQQQLVMQQQLAAQQQQLRQLQSLSNSVASSTRASVAFSRSVTATRNSTVLVAGTGTMLATPAATGTNAVAPTSPSHPQVAAASRQNNRNSRSQAAAVDLSTVPAAVELPSELLDGSDSEDGAASVSSVGRQDGQALLRGVLLERLLQRRKGRLMQKALSTWWRYTVGECQPGSVDE